MNANVPQPQAVDPIREPAHNILRFLATGRLTLEFRALFFAPGEGV
jgi:hypothetical protein